MNDVVWLVLDSCRFDTFCTANTPNFDKIGNAEKRYSYASWTNPSHQVYLMGLMPHGSPKNIYASEVYKKEFSKWTERLGVKELEFKSFLPHLNLPTKLRELGYRTIARVSLPVLNQYTNVNTGFDDYKLMNNHFDFKGMVDEFKPSGSRPSFYFFNIGETHYPYMLEDSDLPHISGVHGVIKRLDDNSADKDGFFSKNEMDRLRKQQVKCVEYIDNLADGLFRKAKSETHFIVTSDHGELFGEDGYFGHGPIFHEKVFEVPFIEGKLK